MCLVADDNSKGKVEGGMLKAAHGALLSRNNSAQIHVATDVVIEGSLWAEQWLLPCESGDSAEQSDDFFELYENSNLSVPVEDDEQTSWIQQASRLLNR